MNIEKEENKRKVKDKLKVKNQKHEKANLLEINANIFVNEIYSKINIEQVFTPEKNIFVLMFIPKTSYFSLLNFEVNFKNKSIISKVALRKINSNILEKENEGNNIEPNIKYSPLYIEEAENCYIVHLGKLPGRNKIIFKTSFIQPITSADMSYQYIIFNKFPELKIINNYEKKYKDMDYYINMTNKDLEVIEIVKIDWVINFHVNSEFSRFIEKLNYKKGYILNKQFYKNLKKCIISHSYYAAFPNTKKNYILNGIILFRTQMMNTPLLLKQYSPEFNETYYILTFIFDKNKMLSSQASEENEEEEFKDNKEIFDDKNKNIKNTKKRVIEKSKDKEKKKEEEENDEFLKDLTNLDMEPKKSYYKNFQDKDNKNSPGLFIFLFDQTFAMQGNNLIYLKDSLKNLISILPKGSYYQLIGFHTFFTLYNKTPIEYNKENYLNSLKQISEMKAEGLTNILEPLNEIYLNGRYNHIDLPRYIIMITDGQINNSEECLDLIEKNNNFFTLHAVGIGENLNQDFIRIAGYLGKGGYDFVFKIKDLEKVLINSLYYLMRDYLSDIFLNFIDIYPDITKKIILKNQDNHFIRQDDIFSIIFNINENLNKEAIEIIFHYNYKNENQKINEDNDIKRNIGNRLSFLFRNNNYIDNNHKNQKYKKILKYFIRNLPEGNEINHLFLKNLILNSDSCISPIYQKENETILKYQIISKYSELRMIENYKEEKTKDIYENKKTLSKTGIILKKNIPIERFKLMDLSMDYYGLLYNYKIGFGFSENQNDEINDIKTNKEKEWYKKKKEILEEADKINKNVEKINKDEEESDMSYSLNELEKIEEKKDNIIKKENYNKKIINNYNKKEEIIKENKNINNILKDNNNKIQYEKNLNLNGKYNKNKKGIN